MESQNFLKFRATKIISVPGFSIALDDKNKKWQISHGLFSLPKIYDYCDLLNFEVVENGDSIMQGKMGGAVIGALTFGAIGAIVGASGKRKFSNVCNSLKVNLTVNNVRHPNISIQFIKYGVNKSSNFYKLKIKKVESFVSILTYIQKQSNNSSNKIDIIDEIKRLAALKDQGFLTNEEFTAKKKQLLGI